ncbi:MAG: KamA family radical SAM protein, partial [Verrucomicrobiota bacterium]|nr:KamA family radical SAM protein [Verrucomicrobiota bacterium]
QIRQIGITLLQIPTVRRIRFATKGLAIMPMKFTSDIEWVESLSQVCEFGREKMKEVALHTHFNTDREITEWTSRAMRVLSETGVRVRNQSVLISGVNDGFDCLHFTSKKLSSQLIQPYYVYLHDMVPGCEHLRTTVSKAEYLSRRLQGAIAGFNTPRVVCDAPGGGGKREISSYTLYDQEIGVSAWTSPTAKPGEIFYYYDPINRLPEDGRDLWANDVEIKRRLARFKADAEAKAEATRT